MITKNTVVAVQSLYAQIEAEYNRQIQEYLSQQMTAPLENIKRHMNAVADFAIIKRRPNSMIISGGYKRIVRL